MEYLRKLMENPSGWDSPANYVGETPDADILTVVTRTRDSDLLTESNWKVAIEKLGGESEDVSIWRFGHWACGWWEALCVREGGPKEEVAREIHQSIKDYPILDEDHFSEMEQEQADQVWKEDYSPEERISYLREHGTDSFNSFQHLLTNIREGGWAPYTNDGYQPLIG